MLYRVIYRWFPIVDVFAANRELSKAVAIPFGYRLMKIREHFDACEERRSILLAKHAEVVDGKRVVNDKGRVQMKDEAAFNEEWKQLLDTAVEDFPTFTRKLSANDLPEGTTAFEVEALYRLGLLEKPEAWD